MKANLQAHGVSFELATTVFKCPFAIERLDDRENYGEDRFVIVGMAEGNVLLLVAYAERENASALFQLEGQPNMSKTTISGKRLGR